MKLKQGFAFQQSIKLSTLAIADLQSKDQMRGTQSESIQIGCEERYQKKTKLLAVAEEDAITFKWNMKN